MNELEKSVIDDVIAKIQRGEDFELIWIDLQNQYEGNEKDLEDRNLWQRIAEETKKGSKIINGFAPPKVKTNDTVLLTIIRSEPEAIKNMPELFKEKANDHNFMIEAIKENPEVIVHMNDELKNDEKFLNEVATTSNIPGIGNVIQDSCPNAKISEEGKIVVEKPETVIEAVQEAVQETVIEAVQETVPETVQETVPETVQETVTETVPEAVPETVPEDVQEMVPRNEVIKAVDGVTLGEIKGVDGLEKNEPGLEQVGEEPEK